MLAFGTAHCEHGRHHRRRHDPDPAAVCAPNAARARNVHVVIFFIILVANIGGALTPLGDPPLFVGFLRGVDFFWPAQYLWLQTVIIACLVLAIFFALDHWFARREGRSEARPNPGPIAGPRLDQCRPDRARSSRTSC